MSVSQRVPWVKVDGRVYADAMSLEVLLADFVEQLEEDGDSACAEQVRRIVRVVGELASGTKGELVE